MCTKQTLSDVCGFPPFTTKTLKRLPFKYWLCKRFWLEIFLLNDLPERSAIAYNHVFQWPLEPISREAHVIGFWIFTQLFIDIHPTVPQYGYTPCYVINVMCGEDGTSMSSLPSECTTDSMGDVLMQNNAHVLLQLSTNYITQDSIMKSTNSSA